MKLILAVIRIAKMQETKEALAEIGLPSFTAMPVLGRGKGHGDMDKARGGDHHEYVSEVPRLKSKRMITLVVTDDKKDLAIETLMKVNSTKNSGDGKIFVVNTYDSYTVRTGVNGDESLD